MTVSLYLQTCLAEYNSNNATDPEAPGYVSLETWAQLYDISSLLELDLLKNTLLAKVRDTFFFKSQYNEHFTADGTPLTLALSLSLPSSLAVTLNLTLTLTLTLSLSSAMHSHSQLTQIVDKYKKIKEIFPELIKNSSPEIINKLKQAFQYGECQHNKIQHDTT